MSWLARSLANSLQIEDVAVAVAGNDEQCDVVPNVLHDPPSSTSPENLEHHQQQPEPQFEYEFVGSENNDEIAHGGGGVQEDLNAIKQTLTNQFWGVASFLAPPPADSPPNSSPSHRQTQSDPSALASNRSEPSSDHQCCSEDEQDSEARRIIRTLEEEASETSPTEKPILNSFGSESVGNDESETEEYGFERAVGITDEVLAFAKNIAMHPETWLDFPIDEEEDTDDFDMSDSQQEHALAIEIFAPRLAALRIELCPCHMSEGYFWKVYFVLLHSRLNKQDAAVLSTPQVMAARAMWMEELQKKMKIESNSFGRSISYSRLESAALSMKPDYETEYHTVEGSETHFIDNNSLIEESPRINNTHQDKDLTRGPSFKFIVPDLEDDEDEVEWPVDSCIGTPNHFVNAEDISFSDLENDDYSVTAIICKANSKAQ